tara:strand:+ start:2360 stop:3151 length:792 start_codon:yes stop_codon:yes gene_type:complete
VALLSDGGGYLPYFKFYPRDWLASPSTMLMTLEEQGSYIRMLCIQWEDGHVSRRSLRGLLRLDDAGIADLLAGPIGESFEEDDAGNLINPRLAAERADAGRLIESKRRAGRASAEARNRGPVTPAKHVPNTRQRVVNNAEAEAEAKADADADTPKVRRKPRNAQVELDGAIEAWQRLFGPMPSRLVEAVNAYLLHRKEERHPLWSEGMWLKNLSSGYSPGEWADAYDTAIRTNWKSVHPRKGRVDKSRNGFADLLGQELGEQP